jgi:ABC-2 type transport system permease protein
LQVVPLLIVTPLTFLGGSFYSIDMLPPLLAHGGAVQPGRLPDQRLPLELLRRRRCRPRRQPGHDAVFLAACIAIVGWIFRTGYRLKN